MADTTLFSRLKKLFSSGVIVRKVGDKKLKVADTAQIQSGVTNATRDRFFRLYTSSGYGTPMSMQYTLSMAYQQQRIMLFRDYDVMDSDSIIHSALDIYAEESTVKDENGQLLTITCEDDDIKEILTNLYYDILNVDHTLYMWIRNLCKYGDHFLYMEIAPGYGIKNVLPLSVYDTLRIEGSDPENPYYYYFETRGMGGRSQKLESYEVAHFRLLGDANFLPYGMSMLEGGRRVFRQLILMEDAMLIHRIMRAPEKRIFYTDIGNIPPNEVENFMNQQINKNKKVPFIDEQSGEYNINYNMQNLLEDYYIPIRGSDSGTKIENLGGLDYAGAIDDIEYLKSRLLASLKIPKAFIGYEETISGKLTLAQEDVRFARTIERIQNLVQTELYKIGIVHLYAQGIDDERLVEFEVTLSSSSTIYEQEKINLWKERVQLAKDLADANLFSTESVYQKFFDMSEDEIEEERERVLLDIKRKYRYEQIAQGQSDPVKFGFPQEVPPPPPEVDGEAPAEDTTAPSAPQTPPEEPGRPSEGSKYGQDSHYAGRDPLGTRERYHVDPSNIDRRKPKKRDLARALESMNAIERSIEDNVYLIENLEMINNKKDDAKVENPRYMREDVIVKEDT